jgi:hypothetical protein
LCKAFRPDHLITKEDIARAELGLQVSHIQQETDLLILITAAGFAPQAYQLAKTYEDRIRLLHGQQLVTMMQRVQPK